MIRKILSLFQPDPIALRERFLERFAGRTIIVHHGVTIGWVGELMKEAGGGAHFRVDARKLPAQRPTPIEWVVHRHVLPHRLPMPLLIKIDGRDLLIRHLVRNEMPVHPSEIYWMLGEFPDRIHLKLTASGQGFMMSRGMPVSDNCVDFNAVFAESADY
ncbi:MAG TPA: hypothetical protein VFN66_07625 [Burkholderiales bacterium]|nr:hypothetical protein [Burkholderiales bacterium]